VFQNKVTDLLFAKNVYLNLKAIGGKKTIKLRQRLTIE